MSKKANPSSKTVVLTFDDGRRDQFTNAFRIMKKYGLKGTIYVTTGFADGTLDGKEWFPSAGGLSMSIDDIRECIKAGFEIGAHSDRHTNKNDDISLSLDKLSEWTGDLLGNDFRFGFGSPESGICAENIDDICDLKSRLAYVRTGTQIRRNGIIYAGTYVLNSFLKSAEIFYLLNKRSIEKSKPEFVVNSVAIKADTPLNHLKYLLEHMPEGSICVLMLHSILTEQENDFKVDKWYYEDKKFEELCKYLADEKYMVKTLMEVMTEQ